MKGKVLLGHGSGGKLTHELISELFVCHFNNPVLDQQADSAVIKITSTSLSFTTDSFVVDPIFFPGGDIGKLAVAGTVNDIAVSGATPLYLSASFIIEEGLPFSDLEKVVASMAGEARKAGVAIVTGDTKVVNRGKCDKIFITTTGIGQLPEKFVHISTGHRVKPGDQIIINGTVGDHGMAVLGDREFAQFTSGIRSDCASLNPLIRKALEVSPDICFMRDATRGGLATVLVELAELSGLGIEIDEEAVPVNENVKGMCELLGYDPLYVANEGKVVMVVPSQESEKALAALCSDPLGKESRIIGEIVESHKRKAWLKTTIGGRRILDMLAGEQLPRIC